jgi:hypothetical protein
MAMEDYRGGEVTITSGFRIGVVRRVRVERRFTWIIHLFRKLKTASFEGARLQRLLKKDSNK